MKDPKSYQDKISKYCKKKGIREFLIFGSYLRDDFSDDSDIDVVVDFYPDNYPSLIEFIKIEEELESLFGRKVDLITKKAVLSGRNPYIRDSIIKSMEQVYVA